MASERPGEWCMPALVRDPTPPPQSLGVRGKLSAARSLERHIGGQSCALKQRNPGQRGRGALGGVQASWDTVFLAFQFA